MSQLIHVEVVKSRESEGSKIDDDEFTGNPQVKSKGSYSEALSVAIKIVRKRKKTGPSWVYLL